MAKELKTAEELRALIEAECKGMDIHSLGVHPDPYQGWFPIVVADPQVVGDYTAHVNRISDRLRMMYELKE